MEHMLDPFEFPDSFPEARDTLPNVKDIDDKFSVDVSKEFQALTAQLTLLEKDFIELHHKLKSTYAALQDIIITVDTASDMYHKQLGPIK